MKILKRRWWLAAAAAVLVAVSAVLTTVGSGGASAAPARATAAKAGNLGQLTGLLPRNKLTPRQRQVFVAIVLNGVPLDALVLELGSSRNGARRGGLTGTCSVRRPH